MSPATSQAIPAPAFTAALAAYDTLRAERLPTALIQGRRDFFGAHAYERADGPGTFHTHWGEHGRPENPDRVTSTPRTGRPQVTAGARL
ncbi:hypothetical protein GTY44_30620, partial [Streptomyces sp. SID5914]|nr:hypothetical protein [Streptomyces sp. SID5914]